MYFSLSLSIAPIPELYIPLSAHFLNVICIHPPAICLYPLPSQPLNRHQPSRLPVSLCVSGSVCLALPLRSASLALCPAIFVSLFLSLYLSRAGCLAPAIPLCLFYTVYPALSISRCLSGSICPALSVPRCLSGHPSTQPSRLAHLMHPSHPPTQIC